MTVSPEHPNLIDSQEAGKKILTEPHLTFVNIGFGYSVMVLIGDGFKTDGASVPKSLLYDDEYGDDIQEFLRNEYPGLGTRWDMENLWEFLVGEPWDMPRLLAAIVHDALYGCKWKWRWLCDWIYRKILFENGYNKARAEVEHAGIRLMGWRNWNAVTDEEKRATRKIVKVEIVRTKKIKKIISRLKG